MIIWLDGTFGVGKTTVAEKIIEKLPNGTGKILDADLLWSSKLWWSGGTLPQCDNEFLSYFEQEIRASLSSQERIVIVVMALTQDECRTNLLGHFQAETENIHIILEASEKTIASRIEQDDDETKMSRLMWLKSNLHYLAHNYKEAIRVDTENKSIDEVATEIVALCVCKI